MNSRIKVNVKDVIHGSQTYLYEQIKHNYYTALFADPNVLSKYNTPTNVALESFHEHTSSFLLSCLTFCKLVLSDGGIISGVRIRGGSMPFTNF